MKTTVILGATSAIAERYARLLATADNKLVLVGRSKPALEEIRQNLLTLGAVEVDCIEHDFLQLGKVDELISQVNEIVKHIDLLLLAYGTLPIQEKCSSDNQYARVEFEVNSLSPILHLNSFVNIFRKQGNGTIVAISSVAGDRGRQSNYLYGSAKAALTCYLSGLRNELAARNIHVLTIKPGFVDTPMTKDFKKSFLWVKPDKVALDIYKAVQNRRDVLYTPWFWKWIMLIIRFIPEFVFKKLKL